MKIVCEACQAKYSISDDKVRGKAFKIRCKKCSHIIVVRSTSASMPTADGSSSAALPVQEGSGLNSPAPVSSENNWHIVVEGEQVGPLSPSDVRARLSRGEITGETFIWREGMADWLKISTVPEFAGAREEEAGTPFPTQPPTTVYPPGTAESAFAASPAGAGEDVFGAPTMVSNSPPTADLFASPAAPEPAPSPSFSFGSPGASMDTGRNSHGNGASSSLTGQRHENSVLFSLSNLEALAAPSAAPASLPRPGVSNTGGSDGSGLIDIRSMAQMTLGSQNEPRHSSDLPTFGAPQFSPVAPVLLPIGPSGGPSRAMYALIGIGLVIALVVGVVAIVMLRKPTAVAPAAAPVVATAPAAAPAAAPTPAPAPTPAAPPVTVTPPANEVLPPREQKAAVAKGGGKKGGKPAKGGKPEASSGVALPPAATASAPKAETKPDLGKRDRLDELLDGALGTKPKPAAAKPRDEEAPAPRPAAAKSLPALEKSDIVKAMMALNPKIHECYNQYKVPGVAMVSVKVADGGRVSGATVTGKFANTPTGSCVESAARTAKFPPTEAQTIQYPFPLR